MSSLNDQQKQLLFDYCIGLTSDEETAEVKALIASNKEASEIYSKLKSALSPLDSIEFEPCPDELVEGTIWRVNNIANTGQLRLQQLLAKEQTQTVADKGHFWWNFGKIAAAAAVIFIVLGTWFAPLDFARQKYRQYRCSGQLASIFQGLKNYISDYDGQPPTVAIASGAPWWKVGNQGAENCSNTRNIWLLVKGNYVNSADFVCPGKFRGRSIQFDSCDAQNYSDFPDRRHITYSIRIKCPNTPCMLGEKPIMADSNPIFDGLKAEPSAELKIQLDDGLLVINSGNHNRRGQNVLFGDGSVVFTKGRYLGDDDIFTLKQMHRGFEVKGCELPSSESDNFLAP
jgi:hypothetical protein